jgi:hypothetical protein
MNSFYKYESKLSSVRFYISANKRYMSVSASLKYYHLLNIGKTYYIRFF